LKNIDEQVQGFLDFVNASPSAFHAVQSAKERLLAQGFVQIKENEEWKLKAGEKYFFTRNHSSIFAFVVGGKYVRTRTPPNRSTRYETYRDSTRL
jgi:aspartyl aminopeptidase